MLTGDPCWYCVIVILHLRTWVNQAGASVSRREQILVDQSFYRVSHGGSSLGPMRRLSHWSWKINCNPTWLLLLSVIFVSLGPWFSMCVYSKSEERAHSHHLTKHVNIEQTKSDNFKFTNRQIHLMATSSLSCLQMMFKDDLGIDMQRHTPCCC